MAIVYSYPTATPETQDLLVGTEMAEQGGEGTPRTRTFTIGSIVDLVTPALNLKANIASPTFTGVVTSPSFVKSGGSSAQYLMANGSTSTFTQDIQSVLNNGGFAENVNVTFSSEGGTTLTLSGTDSNGTLAASSGGEEGTAIVAYGNGGTAIVAIGGTDGIGLRVTSGGISIIGATGAAAPYQLSLSLNSAVKPSTNTWTIASDNRVKTNINPYTKGLETILAINPVTYDYNGKAGFDPAITGNIGIIAQDVLNIIPESIDTYYAKLNEEDEEKTELYNFDSHALTFILINAIKQLSAEIELLKSK